MRGRILGFSIQENQGVIIGEDGKEYRFWGNQWQSPNMPMQGDNVNFVTDMQGFVVSVNTQNQMFNPYQPPMQQVQMPLQPMLNNAQLSIEENYGFFDWVKKCLENYINFQGRARRKEYWFFYLAMLATYMVAMMLDSLFSTDGIFYILTIFGLLIPSLAVTVRRLHDVDRSGWWLLISAIPLVGAIILLVLLATDTKPYPNKWGNPARLL